MPLKLWNRDKDGKRVVGEVPTVAELREAMERLQTEIDKLKKNNANLGVKKQ